MVYLAFALLVIAAAACLGFSRIVPTRILGFLAAAVTFAAVILLLVGQSRGLAGNVPPIVWAVVEDVTITVSPQFGGVALVLASLLLGGATLALLDLALALAPAVRGFGGLFAWILLALAAALPGLSSTSMVIPFSWASVVLLSYGAVRASGALNRVEQIPQGLALGLLASVLLMVGLLFTTPDGTGLTGGVSAFVCIVLACLMLTGMAPFRNTLDEAVLAPAALGGLLYGVLLPMLALGTLLRFVTGFRLEELALDMPLLWRGLLFAGGLLSLLAGAAGALREHSLRHILSWQATSQAGLVVLAIGLQDTLATLALLGNLALSTLVGALAVSVVERLTGSDDFTQLQSGTDLRFPGLLWVIGAASALGLPGLWGFWARLWLFQSIVAQAAWLAPPVLAASVLLFLAYLSPLVRFWWTSSSTQVVPFSLSALQAAVNPFLPVLLLAPLPLLIAGLFPQLVWTGFLATAQAVSNGVRVSTTGQGAGLVVVVLAVVLLRIVGGRKATRRTLSDEDMEPVVLAPDALGANLAFLALIGRPINLIQGMWESLQALGQVVHTAMALFEQRFYLAGVLLAIISLILMMAQG